MTKLARLLVGPIALLAAGAALPAPSTAWAAPPAPGPAAPAPRVAVTPPMPFQDQERAAFLLSTLARFARQAPNRTPFELRFEAALSQHPSARAAALRIVEKYEHMTVDRRRLLLGSHHDATTRAFTDAQALSLAKGAVASGSAHPVGAKPPNVVVTYAGLGCTKTYEPVDAAFGAVYVFHDSPTQPTVTRIKLPGGGQKIPNLTPGSYSSVGATTLYTGPSDAGLLFFESLFVDPVSKPDDLNAPFTTVDEIVDFGVAHAAGAFPPGAAHTGAETLDALAAGLHVLFDIWTKSAEVSSLGAPMRITRIQSAELVAAASAPELSAGPLHFKLSSKHSEYQTDYSMYFDVSPAVAFAPKTLH